MKQKLEIKSFEVDISNFCLMKLTSLIIREYNLKNKIKLYSFYGREIIDSSDLKYLEFFEKFKIIFFCYDEHSLNIDNYRLKCFKLLEKLGEGGFGKVYLSENRTNSKLYAIKFLKLKSSVDLKYVYKEIEALRRLNHNNIIQLYSYAYISHEKVALILEYGRGGTLLKYLKNKVKLCETESKQIFIQLLKAINYCHKNQIIHRDLKPENIIFLDEENKHIKVIDFGVSGLFKGEINKAGSISYMSPEVVSGDNYKSEPENDIWSLGCILYELITGEKLFNGSNFEEKREKVLKGKFILSNTISKEVAHLINKMIKQSPSERISIIDCFDHPWIKNKLLSKEEQEENIMQQSPSTYHNSSSSVSLTNLYQTQTLSKNQVTVKSVEKSNLTATSKFKSSKFSSGLNLKKLYEDKDFNFNTYLRNRDIQTRISPKMNMPSMITKVNNVKDLSLFEINYKIIKNNNGKFISHYQPIGYSKKLKQQNSKIKNLLNYQDLEQKKDKQDNLPKISISKLIVANKSKTIETDLSKNTSKQIKDSTTSLKNSNNKMTNPFIEGLKIKGRLKNEKYKTINL